MQYTHWALHLILTLNWSHNSWVLLSTAKKSWNYYALITWVDAVLNFSGNMNCSVYCKSEYSPDGCSWGLQPQFNMMCSTKQEWNTPLCSLFSHFPLVSLHLSLPSFHSVSGCVLSKSMPLAMSPPCVASCVTGDPSPQVEVYYWPNPMGPPILTNQL